MVEKATVHLFAIDDLRKVEDRIFIAVCQAVQLFVTFLRLCASHTWRPQTQSRKPCAYSGITSFLSFLQQNLGSLTA